MRRFRGFPQLEVKRATYPSGPYICLRPDTAFCLRLYPETWLRRRSSLAYPNGANAAGMEALQPMAKRLTNAAYCGHATTPIRI